MAFYIISFDEIFNKFEAAKARKLCLSSWIITSKTLQVFSPKLLLVGVMEAAKNKKFRRLSGLCSRTLKLLLCFLYVFEHQISYLLLLRIFMLHMLVFRCQNCNLYCIINITKIQNRRQKVFNIASLTF